MNLKQKKNKRYNTHFKADKKVFATEVLLAFARRSHFFRNFLLRRKPLFCGLLCGRPHWGALKKVNGQKFYEYKCKRSN